MIQLPDCKCAATVEERRTASRRALGRLFRIRMNRGLLIISIVAKVEHSSGALLPEVSQQFWHYPPRCEQIPRIRPQRVFAQAGLGELDRVFIAVSNRVLSQNCRRKVLLPCVAGRMI